MATATPSSRWRASAGCSSVNCWKSCFTDVAESWNSATPPVICARLPTSTTRGMTLLERLQYFGRRHRQLGEADASSVLHGVGDRAERRDDGRLADAAHAVRMARVRDFDEDRVDHRHVGRNRHPIVEEARVLQLAVGAVDVLLVERPADALHGPALELPLDVGRVQRPTGVLGDRVAQDCHASGLGIDLEIDEMRAYARSGALRVDSPHAADGTTGLAGDFREVGDRHRLELLGERAEWLHAALLEHDLVGLGLPQLARPRAEIGLDLLRRL